MNLQGHVVEGSVKPGVIAGTSSLFPKGQFLFGSARLTFSISLRWWFWGAS